MVIPDYLEYIFGQDITVIQEYEYPDMELKPATLVFNIKELGSIKIHEGKIIVCDPFQAHDVENVKPLQVNFPKGDVLCQLAVANIDGEDERIGFSRLKFSNNKPIRWELALTEDVGIENIEEGYGVDSGVGGFLDSSAQKEYKKEMDKNEDYWEIIQEKINDGYVATWSALIWDINNTNIAFFSSGYGDGSYPTYIGYDSNDNICRLVTDFIIIDLTAKFI